MKPSWIDEVVDLHREFESPLNFWRWAAIVSISAVIRDNVWLNQGMFNLYPNIYVMLHADSGLKKGPPVNFAKKIVKEVGSTLIISGRSSIQGILKKLSTAETKPGGTITRAGTAFICSSELSSSIVEDKAATDILTDLYDRSYNADDWQSLLKAETFDIKNPTVIMFTATNDAHSSSFFARKDVAGGFFARTFIIFEKVENISNSLLVPPEMDYKKLALPLKEIAKLKGQFCPLGSLVESDSHNIVIPNLRLERDQFYSPAGAIYERWYHDFKLQAAGVKDPTGTINRFGSSVLKVAMLLSLAEEPKLHISESAMETAIRYCENLLGNARQVTIGKIAKDDVSDAGRKTLLITDLLNRESNSMTREYLLKNYWAHGTASEWDDVLMSLQEGSIVSMETMGQHRVIKLTEKARVDFKNHFRGKLK